MAYLESLGLLKMDFLGLRNLTVIRDTVNEIHKIDPNFDISKIPCDDAEVFKMLSVGDTAGVFQFESEGMTHRLMELVPERLEDLIVIISLYRPGPMKSIPLYIENKKHPENIKYLHPILKDILEETFGVMVYQEQVMEICRKLAGYSYGHADIVRRAMAKKKHEAMLRERESFVNGAVERNVPCETADKIFEEMISFASYAFNKSHAAAYAYLAYQTAYLKCHYRGIYMAALMSSVMSGGGRLIEYIDDCRTYGLEVLAPDINMSRRGFAYVDGKMYFGLLAVKNAGALLSDKIISERQENGKFKSLQNFCERVNGRELNKKALENLIKAGAFDGLGFNRRQMLDSYEMLMDMACRDSRGVIEGQMNLFGSEISEAASVKIPHRAEFDIKKLLAMEKEATGIYLSGHPLAEYSWLAELLKTCHMSDILNTGNVYDNMPVKLMCVVQEKKIHTAKNGSKMCFLNVADSSGEIDIVVFPDLYAIAGSRTDPENIIYVKGTVSVKDESVSVLASVIASEQEFQRFADNHKLCIKTGSDNIPSEALAEICRNYPGNTEICFYLTDMRKTVRPKKRLSFNLCRQSADELKKIALIENIGLI